MRGRVLVHIRERPGAAIATAVEFSDLTAGGETADAAIEKLVPEIEDRIGILDPIDRLSYLEAPPAELVRVPVEVPGRKDDDPIEIDLGVVVVERLAKTRTRLIAYVPAVEDAVLSGRGPDSAALAKRLAERAAKEMRSWRPVSVLGADEPADSRVEAVDVDVREGGSDSGAPEGILGELGVELTKGDGGRIDRRDELVRRTLETLASPGRSSVLLVGRADVGKSALVHEIARRVASNDVPEALRGKRVWRISANELIAGAQYTGMWQDRVRRLLAEARGSGAVVAMGDPAAIVDAGRWSQSDNNVSRYLRPFVEGGDVTLICECTPEQFEAAHKKEPSFLDAFHRIDVPEPSVDETVHIARAAAERLAAATGVRITDDAITSAVELTRRFEPYRSFPGKAVRLIEDAVRERAEGAEVIDRAVATETFARRTGMPLALLSDAVPLSLDDVRSHFDARVLGQPEAVAAMTDVIAVIKSGLNSPGKPLGSFFFVGPTGVGKTELAKAVAEFLFGSRDRVIRLDMGEYATGDAVQRLIGNAWGHEGELTKQVRQQPFCVVLLDELEKANHGVFDALLAALGEGRLTDASGRTADFRNAIVIMTSNLGATRAQTQSLGFGQNGGAGPDSRYVEEAEKFFRPEFFNRIDRIVVFHSLGVDAVRGIARRELDQLLEREGVIRRDVRVEVDDAVVEHVAATGFHPKYGARPLQREIEQTVIGPLAHAILRKAPTPADIVRIRVSDGAIAVTVEQVEEKPRAAKRAERRATVDDAAFTKARRAAEAFLESLDEDDAATDAADVKATISRLVEATHHPSFWDDPDRARDALQRIYRLERVADAFQGIRSRADGLVAMAKRVAEARDRARIKEISEAIDEMSDRLLVVRLELAAAAVGADRDRAVIRVVPVGPTSSAWADRLVAMYEQWAERTARDVTRAERRLVIDGLASFDLLQGETGLHKHVQAERVETLARVIVSTDSGTSEDTDGGAVVRVYEEGAQHVVRDPRTGAKRTHVPSVLEDGVIDAFLIAWLRDQSSSSQPA